MVAVIGHSAWMHLFGGDPRVIGSAVAVNGMPVTIVGVAPERFRGLPDPGTFQLWLPLSTLQLLVPAAPDWLRAVGRLRAGVGRSAATAAVQVVASRATESSEELRLLDPSAEVVPLLARNAYAGFEEETQYLSVAVSLLGLLVLLIICTNASTLLTGLATARRHEIAVRLSLGAARRRLIRQLLTESALLACIAGIAGLGVVWGVLRSVTAFVPVLPFELRISLLVTTFTFGVALSVGVLFGLAPALHATRLALAGVLHDSSAAIAATRARLQRGLVVAQIALTQPLIVLLAASLLLVLGELQPRRQTEFADRVIATGISLPAPAAGSTADESLQRLHTVMRRLIERLENTPGVEAVAIYQGGASPLGAYVVDAEDRVGDGPFDPIRLSGIPADRRYFEVMGIPLVRGRAFTVADAGAQTAETSIIVGDDLTRKLWGDRDPIGRRLRATADTASIRALVVVGVIAVDEVESASQADEYQIHVPADSSQTPPGLLIRTAGLAEPLIPTIRGVINEEAPATVISLRTLAQVEAADARTFRMLTRGVSAAGLIALLLSAIGLYAVVAFSVGQRTREIAIRIAVGSSRQRLVRRFLADGLRLSVIGLVLGLPISLIGLRALTILLRFPWPVTLPPITAIATTGVIIVATIAVWIPAQRAASVDPASTLRRG
jgi:predicted permease